MNVPSKRRAILAWVAAALVVAPAVSHAQGYPNKPIRMVVPWAAGGTSDTVWRIVGPKLAEALGQPVLLDNRPGAASTIGAAIVAAARPDGYTLLATSNVHVLSANLYKTLPYHAIDDFLPVAQIAQTCSVLVVHPSLPVKTASEFVSHAKGNPGKIDFSSTGNGSGQHLFMEQIMAATGISLNHVPYKNVGQALAELIGGQVKASVPGVSIVSQHVREGRLRALAVTCAQPSRFLPDVPTLAATVAPGYDATLREGLMAPKGTPAEIVSRLEAELRKILAAPDAQKAITGTTSEPIFASAAEFSQSLRADFAKWQKLVKDIGIQVQ